MPASLNDVIEVTAKLSFRGISAIRNVYHFKVLTASAADDIEIAGSFAYGMANMYAEVAGIMPNDVLAETVQVVNLTANRTMGEVPWPVAFAGGTSTANSYALGVSAVVRLLTAARGVQGRKFLGSLCEGAVGDDALLDVGAVANILDFAEHLMSSWPIEGGSASPGVYNRITRAIRGLTGYIISAIPGYQRRRKQGLGI